MKLSVEQVSLDRGGKTVVEDLSFQVEGGEALIVSGPNGAGKTTLIRAIAGFIAPAAGRIRFTEFADTTGDLTDAPPIGERVHVVGHLNGIKPTLTVAENLTFSAAYLGSHEATAAQVAAALDRLGLGRLADIPAGLLSAGQKRRLGLARLVAAKRPLWLLDEPTVSLDVASTRLVAGMIDEHVGSGGIAVVVTHVPLGLTAARELELLPVARGDVASGRMMLEDRA